MQEAIEILNLFVYFNLYIKCQVEKVCQPISSELMSWEEYVSNLPVLTILSEL